MCLQDHSIVLATFYAKILAGFIPELDPDMLLWLTVSVYAEIIAVIIIIIWFHYMWPRRWVVIPREAVVLSLLLYWISVFLMLSPIVFREAALANSQVPPMRMAVLAIFLTIFYFVIDRVLLELDNYLHFTRITRMRIIFLERFNILGYIIRFLDRGWRPIAVRLFDVLIVVWLVHAIIIPLLWMPVASSQQVIDNITYFGNVLSRGAPLNGSVIDGFYIKIANPNDQLLTWSYSGASFFHDLVSSIFFFFWFQWDVVIAIWIILEVLVVIWSGSKRMLIEEFADIDAQPVDNKGAKKDASSPEKSSSSQNLANLLAVKLERINQIYEAVDEKRPIESVCGAGEPIDATIKAGNLDDLSASSSANIGLGPLSVPTKTIFALISRLCHSPMITIRLHKRDMDSNGRETFFLTATMSNKQGSKSWVVESPDPLDKDISGGSTRSIEDMVTEMAHRIFASLESERTEKNIPWKAMWYFNEGLRAYRDCLKTTKEHKINLNHAEKNFIDAIEDYNNFGQAYYNLGVVYSELGQIDSAQACFQKTISVNPEDWEAYYALGLMTYRRAKGIEEQFQDIGETIPYDIGQQMQNDYQNVLNLAKRVLDMKNKWFKRILNYDSPILARAYNLKGNAQVRLAMLDVPGSKNYNRFFEEAKNDLVKAVHYSWMARFEDCIRHDAEIDESKIIAESTLDLADLYLKMIDCLGPIKKTSIRDRAESVLLQSIYVNPDYINLYIILAKIEKVCGETKCSKKVYEQAHRINPECPRLKALKACVEDNETAALWAEECERSSLCDDEKYIRVWDNLVDIIEDKVSCDKLKCMSFKREKALADISKVAEDKVATIHVLERMNRYFCPNHSAKIIMELHNRYPIAEGSSEVSESIEKANSDLLKKMDDGSLNCDYIELLNDLMEQGLLFMTSGMVKLEKLSLIQKTGFNDAGRPLPINNCSKKDEEINQAINCLDFSYLCLDQIRIIIKNRSIKNTKSDATFCKNDMSYYLVEAGKALLQLGEFKKSMRSLIGHCISMAIIEKTPFICFNTAVECFEEALKILNEANSPVIKRNKIRMHLARAFHLCGKDRDALKEAQKAKDLNPLDCDERLTLGDIFCDLKEFKLGLRELENALSRRTGDPDLLLRIGMAYLLAGKDCRKKGEDRTDILDTANKYLNEALEVEDRSKVMKRAKIRYWIGRTLMELGKYDEAIPHMRILSQSKKIEPLPSLCLGYAYWKCNAHEDSEKILWHLIESNNPSIGEVYGMELGDEIDANELTARAHIYLAYSYAERNANIYDSWKIASKSQKYIEKMINDIDEDKPTADSQEDIINVSFLDIDCCLLSVPAPNNITVPDLAEMSRISIEGENDRYNGSAIGEVVHGYRIRIKRDASDGTRKRIVKAHLAECAGVIFHELGDLQKAIEFLDISISLYPDAGAYLNLAKAWEGKLLKGGVSDSEKNLINRRISDLCLHADKMDIKKEHYDDLSEFKKAHDKNQNDSATEEQIADQKSGKKVQK